MLNLQGHAAFLAAAIYSAAIPYAQHGISEEEVANALNGRYHFDPR